MIVPNIVKFDRCIYHKHFVYFYIKWLFTAMHKEPYQFSYYSHNSLYDEKFHFYFFYYISIVIYLPGYTILIVNFLTDYIFDFSTSPFI